MQQGKQVAGELRAFGAALVQRFGEEGVRAMLRAGDRLGAATAASVALEQRAGLDRVAELTAALKAGELRPALPSMRRRDNDQVSDTG